MSNFGQSLVYLCVNHDMPYRVKTTSVMLSRVEAPFLYCLTNGRRLKPYVTLLFCPHCFWGIALKRRYL